MKRLILHKSSLSFKKKIVRYPIYLLPYLFAINFVDSLDNK